MFLFFAVRTYWLMSACQFNIEMCLTTVASHFWTRKFYLSDRKCQIVMMVAIGRRDGLHHGQRYNIYLDTRGECARMCACVFYSRSISSYSNSINLDRNTSASLSLNHLRYKCLYVSRPRHTFLAFPNRRVLLAANDCGENRPRNMSDWWCGAGNAWHVSRLWNLRRIVECEEHTHRYVIIWRWTHRQFVGQLYAVA